MIQSYVFMGPVVLVLRTISRARVKAEGQRVEGAWGGGGGEGRRGRTVLFRNVQPEMSIRHALEVKSSWTSSVP